MKKNVYSKTKVEMLVHEYLERNNILVERNEKDDFAMDVALKVFCEIEDCDGYGNTNMVEGN